MKRKKVIVLSIVFFGVLILVGLLVASFFFMINSLDHVNDRIQEPLALIREENQNIIDNYIATLLDNKEDFDYAGEILSQWDSGAVYFGKYNEKIEGNISFDDNISSDNEDVINELTVNKKFYDCMTKIYETGQFEYIILEEGSIWFHFSEPQVAAYYNDLVYHNNDYETEFESKDDVDLGLESVSESDSGSKPSMFVEIDENWALFSVVYIWTQISL